MNIIITAGGTREYIDPVRFISNASSGKMGYALADAAIKAGHKVLLISAPVNIKAPSKAKLINVVSSNDMFEAVKSNFSWCGCLVMAAAVSDYSPAKTSRTKLKKKSDSLVLKLKPTKDILLWAGKNKKEQILVGFALEDQNIFENAEKKLKTKHLDIIIANSPAAIGSEKSELFVKTIKSDWQGLGHSSKSQNARTIIKIVSKIGK